MISTFKLFKESSENKKKEIIFLIGPPGSGKSTYIKKLQKLKELTLLIGTISQLRLRKVII